MTLLTSYTPHLWESNHELITYQERECVSACFFIVNDGKLLMTILWNIHFVLKMGDHLLVAFHVAFTWRTPTNVVQISNRDNFYTCLQLTIVYYKMIGFHSSKNMGMWSTLTASDCMQLGIINPAIWTLFLVSPYHDIVLHVSPTVMGLISIISLLSTMVCSKVEREREKERESMSRISVVGGRAAGIIGIGKLERCMCAWRLHKWHASIWFIRLFWKIRSYERNNSIRQKSISSLKI